MADLSAIRADVADKINALGGTRAWPYPPDQVNAPAILVEPDEVAWDTAFGRGHEKWTLRVVCLIATAHNTAAMKARDEFFGGIQDLKDAIEANPTPGIDIFVRSARKFNAWKFADVTYLGVEVVVEVRA